MNIHIFRAVESSLNGRVFRTLKKKIIIILYNVITIIEWIMNSLRDEFHDLCWQRS